MKTSIAILATLTTAIAFGAVAPPSYSSASSAVAPQSVESSSEALYTDAEVLEFMISGHGTLAEELPELSIYVPEAAEPLTARQLERVVDVFLSTEPNFHELVTVPFQSGDPFQTLGAIDALQSIAEQIGGVNARIQDGGATGQCATVLVIAMAIVVVLGLFLWSPATSSVGDGTTITDESFAAGLATAFASR
ncbi:hypothetical protein ACWIBQ_07890 [Microbacterium keratanolyticum]